MLVALLAMAGIATAQKPKEKPLRRSSVASLPSGYTSNDKVAFGVSHTNGGSSIYHYSGFDIRVKSGENWYSTTYRDQGYATVIQVDGANMQMIYGNDESDGEKFAFGKTYTVDGIQVFITARIPTETPDVVEITYHVKNTNSVAKTIDLGSCADTQVGDDDDAQVSKSGNKITMSNDAVSYSLVVRNSANPTALTSVWYGSYSWNWSNYVFSNKVDGGMSNTDSATAWSWHFTLDAGAEQDFVVGGGQGATVVDNTGTVSMENYTYGAATNNPSVSGYNGNPEITYYYNTTNSNQGGTPWSLDAGGSLIPGTYYMYAVLAATDGYNEYTTDPVAFTVSPADNTGTVGMSNYIYGAATDPSVSGYKGNPEITYYYNTTNSNQGGTPWSQEAGGSLKPGTYYMYAVLAATDCYKAYTTEAVSFTVSRADNTGTVIMSDYTYLEATEPSVNGSHDNPEITYYYNTTNSNEGGTPWSLDAGGSLKPGTYYMYAVLAATDCYNAYTTAAVSFTVNPADNTGTVSMDDYTYLEATDPSVSGYHDNPEITYYYNTTNSNQGGTPWSLDAGRSLNAGTYYMYAKLAATDCYKEYTTAPVEFTVNPIVYDAGSSSDAIDLEVVPDNLGAMDGTNGPTDLAAFLEDYQKMHVNPAYIRLKLKADGNYIITRSLKTFSAIHILGDKDYPSHIDASQLGAKPFVIIDRNHQVNEKNEKGFLTSIYNVEFKDIVVTGLKGQVFYADQQKYLIPYFTVDNCVFRMEGASNKTFFDFKGNGNGSGFVENLTVTNSTLSGDNATQWTNGGFFSTERGSTFAEAGAQKFTQTLTNNTFYNVAKGKTLSTLRENSKAWMSFTIKDNVIVNSGKSGQFVRGLNNGQNSGTPSWLIRNNSFTFDGADVSANEVSDASKIAIVANVTGQIVFANGDEGVAVGDFSLDACPQKEAKIGDPRWLNASKLSKYITMAEIDDDNDLAKTINYYVEQGFSKFRLEDNGRYTVKQSIVTDKAISITGENVQIDVESGDDFIKVANVAGEKAKKADGSDSNYTIVESIILKGLTIKGLTKSLINNTSGNVVFTKISIDDDVIDFSGSSAVFALGNGYPEDLTITKSTLWSQAGHTGFLFQAQGRPKDATGSTSWTIEKSTLYQIAKGKKMNNNNSGIKGQSTTKLTLTESILFETGSNTGNEINGWLFGQNSASPVRTYNKNTYWAGNAEATGWTDSSKTGSDQTGTALTTDPGFKKPAEGDFTLSMYAAQLSEKTGDPRWFAEGGHVNPTAIETVKTAEGADLENAVIYNLNGQRVEKAQKGINIVNGKKVIIK